MISAALYIITGIASLIVQSIYFILDDRAENHTAHDLRLKKIWHLAGGAIHIWMGVAVGDLFSWHYGLVMGSLTWLLFDGCINTYALGREFWYIGTTAIIDKAMRWLGKLIQLDHRTVTAIMKIATVILSLIILIKSK